MLIRCSLRLVAICCVLAAARPVVGDSGSTLGVIVAENAAPVADGFLAAFTPALVGQSFILVDRSHIQKLIAEQSLSITGVMRDPLRLGQLIGAPYLIYLTADTTPAGSTVSLLLVEVASGNVLLESVQPWQPDQAGAVVAAARNIADAVALARKQSAKPAAAVLSVHDRGPSQRLRFLQSTLRGTLEQMLAQRGWRVLRRTHADQLAKETTLSAAGLTRPDAEVLARAADLAVSVEFVEHPASDLAFEQTPIALTLTIRRGEQADTRTLNFTLQNTQPLHDDLAKAIPPAPGSASTVPQPADNTGARLETAHLMAQVDTTLHFTSAISDHERRIELCQRIVYLDPSVKEAYYWMGQSFTPLITEMQPMPSEKYRPIPEGCRDAFENYLRFPRDDRDHVNWAFTYVIRGYSMLRQLDRDNKAKCKQLEERMFEIAVEYAQWCCSTDWTGSHFVVNPIMEVTSNATFEKWWTGHSQSKASFKAWVEEMATKNPTLKKPGTFPIDLTPAPVTAMYGDFFGDPPPPDMYRMSYNADWFMTHRFEAADVPAVDELLPDGIKSTLFITRTSAGLWFVGSASDFGSPVPRGLTLYHQPDESQPIQRIELPEAWRQSKMPSSKLMSAIVQVGDEIVWSAGPQTTRGGPPIPEKLFTYNVKKRTFAAYGVADGIPSDTTCFVLPSADGRSAWLLSAGESSPYKSFLTRYQAGRFYLADKCDLQHSTGLLLTDQATFNLTGGEMQIQIGGPEGRSMRTLVDGKTYTRLLPMPSYFRVGRGWGTSTAVCNNIVRAGDHVYALGVGGGLLVFSTKGEIEHFWHPRTFWYWKELGGFLDGNCPLPPTNAWQVTVDDADPTRLWILGRDHRKGAPGVFITCFDTTTQKWSLPQRVSGGIMMVQPFGEHLYLTGVGMKRVPKSAWKTDQVAPTGQPAIHTADTLFGKAAAALYAGDFAETRRLLTQAADQNIAADKAKQMLKDLDALEAKTTKQ